MSLQTEDVLGFAICASALDTTISEICDQIDQHAEKNSPKPRPYFACLNAHSYNLSLSDVEFRKSLNSANLLVPDGAGILLAAKALGKPINQRITGDDIFEGVNRELNNRGNYRIFFLGSTNETLEKIKLQMARDYNNLEVCGTYSPPFKSEYSPREINQMVIAVNKETPDVLWVGMTAPKQEKWIADNIVNLEIGFAGPIGAVFDFYSGNVSRAPKQMQNLGFEWLYRLIRQPRKLAKRYIAGNPLFVVNLIRFYLKKNS